MFVYIIGLKMNRICSIITKYCLKIKGEWIYIFNRKIAYYTKETFKFINIIAIGVIIILGILSFKYKSVYAVYLNGEEVGYVKSRNDFENLIEEKLYDNKEENIAFSTINVDTQYKLKLLDKQIQTNEEGIFTAIKENSDITYFRYAINVNSEPKVYTNSLEEAEQVVESMEEDISQDIEVSILKIYETQNQSNKEIQIATLSQDLSNSIHEEEKRIEATVNGVYLAKNPVVGNITSRYGAREKIRDHTHQGLDIAAKIGTKIQAVADGKVTYSGELGGYGNLIKINHGNGVETYYGHCSKIYVKVGTEVKAGDIIGLVGSTGNSTGPHLHLEVRLNGKVLDPLDYLYK